MTDDQLWAEYARISKYQERARNPLEDQAYDAALNLILDVIESSTGANCTTQTIKNKYWNSLKTGRRRAASDLSLVPDQSATCPSEARREAMQRVSLCEGNERFALLASVQGYSQSEIAQELDAPVATVKTWVRRAKRRCAELPAQSGSLYLKNRLTVS